jgi:hypothetical protein
MSLNDFLDALIDSLTNEDVQTQPDAWIHCAQVAFCEQLSRFSYEGTIANFLSQNFL